MGGIGYQAPDTDLSCEAEGYCAPHDTLQLTNSPLLLQPDPHSWPPLCLPCLQCLSPGETSRINSTNSRLSLSPHLLNLPHLSSLSPLGVDQGRCGRAEDEDDDPHEHVGPGAVH